MKKLITLIIPALFAFSELQAQANERSISAGIVSQTHLLKPYGDEQWLLAGRGEPEPGGYFHDTLFIAVIGHDGQINLRKNLKLPASEIHYWHDVLALPDGGILASFESTLCDVGADNLSIQRLDAQGNLMWEKTGGFIFGTPRPPENWSLSPDGNLLGGGYDQIWKVDVLTGDVLWTADLQGVNGGDLNPYEFAFLPGTEDFFALGNPDYQYWKKAGSPSAPVYMLVDSMELPGYRTALTAGPNNTFYCWQRFPENKIERINLNFQLEVLPIQVVQYGEKSISVGNNGIYLAESSSETHQVRRFDFQGQNPVNLHSSEYWLSPMAIVAHNGWIAVGGQDGSGVPFWASYNLTCGGAWIRTFPESDPTPVAATPNAAVTEIEQQALIDTAGFPAFPIGKIYNLYGGDYKVKITNAGNILLDKVCVNVTFGFNEFFDICPNKPSMQKRYDHLNLAPGESTWLNFGNIQAKGQALVPTEICFWTSSPNDQPDAVHEDDLACHPVSYFVGVKNPSAEPIALFPNPADDFAECSFTSKMEGEIWQIRDAAGRLVSSGICASDQKLRLETSGLPSGFYWLSIQNRIGKLVVQH